MQRRQPDKLEELMERERVRRERVRQGHAEPKKERRQGVVPIMNKGKSGGA